MPVVAVMEAEVTLVEVAMLSEPLSKDVVDVDSEVRVESAEVTAEVTEVSVVADVVVDEVVEVVKVVLVVV